MIHPSVIIQYPDLTLISKRCSIGANTCIGPFCEIRDGATIGKGCYVGAHCVVDRDVYVGNNVVMGEGTMLISLGGCHHTRVNVVIDDDVTFGPCSRVVGCVHIGKSAEIRAGACVTYDVQKGETVLPSANLVLPGQIPG